MNEICAVFPGEGSQYVGMAKPIFDKFDEAKELFLAANQLLKYSLSDVIFNGDAERLSKQEVLQPAILTASCAFYRVLCKNLELRPTHLTGYGIGSISALACAHIITFQDAVLVAQKRGQIIDKTFQEKTYFVSQIEWEDSRSISQIIAGLESELELSVVAYISEKCCVVCAPIDKKRNIMMELSKLHISVTTIPNSVPVGSANAKDCAELFEKYFAKIKIYKSHKKVFSFLDGMPYQGTYSRKRKEIAKTVAREIIMPLDFNMIMNSLEKNGITKLINIGPSEVCSEWIKKAHKPKFKIATFDWKENAFYCVDFLNERKIFNYMYLMKKMLSVAVSIQNNCFDEIIYEGGVIQPINRMKERYEKCFKDKARLKDEDIAQQRDDLIQIMRTKGLDSLEIEEQLLEIENETLISFTEQN